MRVDSSRAAVIEKKPVQAAEPQHMTRHLMRSTDLSRFDEWELVAVIPDQGDPAMAFFYFRRRR